MNKRTKESRLQKLSNAILRIVSNRTYWVFRRYRQVESFNSAEGALIEEIICTTFCRAI